MPFDFDTIIDRRHTDSVKWDKYGGRHVIPMWVADMDFASPPAVIEALRNRVGQGVFGYTHASEQLSCAVVQILESRYGWGISPDWIVWLPGLVTGLNLACRSTGDPGDSVISATPVYPPFLTAPANFDRRLIRVPMVLENGRWSLDFEGIRRSIARDARLFLLCNPHNPVGRVFSRAELEALSEICLAADLVVCSDEIHCDLILDKEKRHVPFATLSPEVADRTITLMAPSKTFNLPGLGCAFAVIPNNALRARYAKSMAGIVPHVNALGYAAALAAYRDGWPWLESLIEYLRGNRDILDRRLQTLSGLEASHVEATYLAWIDARGIGAEDPVSLFEKAGVGLFDGRAFDGPGFVRLNFGCPRALLTEALDRMQNVLKG